MDAIEKYIERLSEPAVRSFCRSLNHVDEDSAPDPKFHGTMSTEEQVLAAEAALGIALPPSYRKLVTSTEPTDGIPFVYWVNADQPFGADIVGSNRGPDGPFHPFLIKVFAPDGGDEYCLDTRHIDDRGEYPIVFFDHEIHNEDSTDFKTVAKNLGEFLLESLEGFESEFPS